MFYCTNCGARNTEDAEFCINCGQNFSVAIKPASRSVLIIRIIVLVALILLLVAMLFIYVKDDHNLLNSDLGLLNKYFLIFVSIISVLAQIYLIFILVKRWDIKTLIHPVK